MTRPIRSSTVPEGLGVAAVQRGEAIAGVGERAARLEATARAFAENSAQLAATQRRTASFWSGCCGGAAAAAIDHSAHVPPTAAAAIGQAVVATRPAEIVIPSSAFTKKQVEDVCRKMKIITAAYEPHDPKRIGQLTTFNALIGKFESESMRLSETDRVSEATYNKLKAGIESLKSVVAQDHRDGGGFWGIKVFNESAFEGRLRECLELFSQLEATVTGRAIRAATR